MKFMKHDMLAWNGIKNVVVKILSHLGQAGVVGSHKSELLTTSLMVKVGNFHLSGRNDIRCLFLISTFSSVNIEQHECCVKFWKFLGFVWTFLYLN